MDDAQEKPRPGPPRDVEPRDDVHVSGSPVRCPFCHEDVAIEGEWSACSRCLARHHQPCWAEGGRCGSCGHDGAVRHGREAPKRADPTHVRWIAAIGVALLVGVAAALFFGVVVYTRFAARRAPPPVPHVEPASVAGPRPAARYEQAGALVVDDGRGNFVIVFEAEDAVLVGLNVILREVREDAVVVDRSGFGPTVLRRPLVPLTVCSGRYASRQDLPRPGLTVAEVAEILRRNPPPMLDVEYLLERARGD